MVLHIKEVLESILEGDYDICLKALVKAIDTRQSVLLQLNRPELTAKEDRPFEVGDVVMLSNHCQTAYLRGKHVKIVDKLQKNFKVEFLDGPIGRFGKGVRVPPTLLTWIQ